MKSIESEEERNGGGIGIINGSMASEIYGVEKPSISGGIISNESILSYRNGTSKKIEASAMKKEINHGGEISKAWRKKNKSKK